MSIEGEEGPMAQALWVVGMIPGTFFDPALTETRNT
jgi:hypothetical protein